ncbi:hypothetical protein IMZ68_03750, partial [Candidatus Bathyarchaeota archaeon]|nr:hypothetical protein [Candidatus Bathyarchaeota archaeon]
IYCIGSITQVYDPATGTWENKTAIPTSQIGSPASVVNGKIYIISSLNQVYDIATDNWTIKASPPEHFYGAPCVYEGKIYMIGTLWTGRYSETYGFLGTKSEPMTQIYDPNTDSWSQGATSKGAAGKAFAVVTVGVMAPSKIYDLYNPSHALDSVTYLNQVYDPDNGTWVSGAMMPDRMGFGVAVVDDLVYVVGGYTLSYPSQIDPLGVLGYNYREDVLRYTPFGYGTVPPKALIVSPQNASNFTVGAGVSFNFTVNRPVDWLGYSLDGKENITVTGNFTLSVLSTGSHNVTVYAKDSNGNVGASETIAFGVSEKTFPFATVVGIAVTVAVVVIGLSIALIISKKRKNRSD